MKRVPHSSEKTAREGEEQVEDILVRGWISVPNGGKGGLLTYRRRKRDLLKKEDLLRGKSY